jgi:predicted transcriptional regulator
MTARTHVPPRSRSSSSRSTASSITGYSHRLTKRDYQILIELHEHRVLTTPQIYELHFETLTRASKRMLQLYRLGLIERFRPHVPTGSAPWHYTLDEPGARLVAARQEVDFRDFPFKKARIFDVVGSPRLRHRIECNGFFARLALACRRRGWRLEWTGERRSAAEWYASVVGEALVTPDGIGRISAGDREISFFLEYDRATEHHEQLERKIDRYHVVQRWPDRPDALLFLFPSAAREREVRRSLPGPGFTLATAVRHDVLRDPLGPVWLPLREDRRRPILDLPLEPRDKPG